MKKLKKDINEIKFINNLISKHFNFREVEKPEKYN